MLRLVSGIYYAGLGVPNMNFLGKRRLYFIIGLQIGCSGSTNITTNVVGSSGASSSGGAATGGLGASSGATGGATPIGTTSTGGTATGGTTSTGMTTGGASPIGSSSTGGAATGGVTHIGTSSTGGAATGGASPIGASSTGGAATGGASPIGASSTGGAATGGASPIGSSSTGGAATGGASPIGSSSTGGSAAGGTSGGATVSVLGGPWGDTSTNEPQVTVSIDSIDSPSYILVAITGNATDGSESVAASTVSYRNLQFKRLVGGNIAGTAFSSEFWGARSSTVQLPNTMTVTMSAPSNAGVHVWALSGVNASTPVGSSIDQAQLASNLYQVTFSNKRYGSLLFGAFFDTLYAQDGNGYLPITAQAGSVVKQTYAAYSVWSVSALGSGSQTIGASLPSRWTIEHSAIEIVP